MQTQALNRGRHLLRLAKRRAGVASSRPVSESILQWLDRNGKRLGVVGEARGLLESRSLTGR